MKTEKKIKKKSKKYFTKIHEDAVLEYVATDDNKKRNQIYVKILRPALTEMIKKIVYRYKFTSLPNIVSLIDECEGHLVSILNKYDKNRNTKAFSYFTRITINWFIQKGKKHSKQQKETLYDKLPLWVEEEFFSIENPFVEKTINEEFITNLWEEISNWENLSLKPNERKTLEAIKILLFNPESIDIFNKKAIYLYVREITGLNTKQILNNFNKFRKLYKNFKNDWLNKQ